MTQLNPGATLMIGRAASVQFAAPIRFRLIRVLPHVTYDGWVWLDGYELGSDGQAVARREIFVQRVGVRVLAEQTAMDRLRQSRLNGGPPAAEPRRSPASPSTRNSRTRS